MDQKKEQDRRPAEETWTEEDRRKLMRLPEAQKARRLLLERAEFILNDIVETAYPALPARKAPDGSSIPGTTPQQNRETSIYSRGQLDATRFLAAEIFGGEK